MSQISVYENSISKVTKSHTSRGLSKHAFWGHIGHILDNWFEWFSNAINKVLSLVQYTFHT